MIPSDTNPFGLEYKNLTFHVIRNDKEIEIVSTKDQKYRYAEFPQNLVSKYGKEWSLQPGKDYESYLKLKKYVSRGEQEWICLQLWTPIASFGRILEWNA